MSALAYITQIVAVGSVDGVCTTAALLRLIGAEREVGLQFTQAFQVDRLDVSKWDAEQEVALVDLAVNNRDPSMTAAFVARVRAAGHELVAVIDEHSREDWLGVLGTFDGLIVEPESQAEGMFRSSGSVLRAVGWLAADEHTLELLEAADQADRGNFATRFGGMVNEAVKSAIQDDARRVYLARHLAAGNTQPDAKIAGWIAEYGQILANHDLIVDSKVDRGDGIHRVNAVDLQVDMTTLMFRLYGEGARVVALYGEAFVPAEKRKRTVLSLGTNDKSLDLMAIARAAGINPLGGFAQKVNVEMADEETVLAAIRAALQG